MSVAAAAQPSTASLWRLAVPRADPIVVMNDGAVDAGLFCVHSVTGDIGALDGFARHFGGLRLCGLQVPRREMVTLAQASIETMARHHADLLDAAQPTGPIRLIGWSAGAIVALEMAQQLRARGRDVPLLVALDGAPCNTGAGLSPRDPRYLLKVIANLPRWIRDDRTSDWTLQGIRRRLSEKLAARRGAGTLKNVDTLDGDTMESLIARPGWTAAQKAFVHNMYQAMLRYVPQRYDGHVLVFETRTQPLFHLRQIGPAWRAIAADMDLVAVPGNHSGLVHEPAAAELARAVTSRLGRI